MKATHLLHSLLLYHAAFLAIAAAKLGSQYNEYSQLTLVGGRSQDERDNVNPGKPARADSLLDFDPLQALQDGLEVMQSRWFALWVGTWPTAIDWTAAVIDTHLVTSLSTLSKALKYHAHDGGVEQFREVENDLNKYFSQNVAYYFGEDAFALRNQAYDDMLWVVLGWLESTRFIRSHSNRHYGLIGLLDTRSTAPQPWQGAQFISAFSHRARLFYDIASNGWDETLCGGGMVWSPYLGPYKNAITNELFIAASIGMYLYFPGDNNTSPFLTASTQEVHDPAFLHAAVRGYAWLKSSVMRNHLGLYTDGFHISDWKHGGTTCDIRDEMVYTYNQGVVLSALRGLWEGTGNTTYLTDAHELVRDVIRATGWSVSDQKPLQDRKWHGLGRRGILEERCDASGTCSQDGQMFKGIFFRHLALLCEPLPLEARAPGKTFAADEVLAALHRNSCGGYARWVAHNARAAVGTRDEEGQFGGWWGAGLGHGRSEEHEMVPGLEEGESDYRNDADVLRDPLWLREAGEPLPRNLEERAKEQAHRKLQDEVRGDPNDRGRGRTVETQSGGIAVLRCLWELLHL